MKRITRIFLIITLVLVLILGSVFIALTFYKKELTQIVIDELRLKYGLTLVVEDVDVSFLTNWPHTSVQLKNVSVSSNSTLRKNESFLRAGSLAVSFNFLKMLQKQFIVKYVAIKDVDLNLIKYVDGTKNFEITKPKDTTQVQSGLSLNLDKITLKNVKLKFVNEERGQKIGIRFSDNVIRLKNYEDGVGIKIKGDVLVNGLLLNPEAGEFLTNTRMNLQLEGVYFFKEKTICVLPPSYTEIEGHRYNLTSIIDLSEKKRLSLIIESKAVKSERVATYLTPKIRKVLSNFIVLRPLDAKVLLVARLGIKENPIIIADIIGNNCDLTIGNSKIPYSNLYFKGRVLSMHPSRDHGDMQHATIVFKSIKGKLYDFPLEASLSVLDLPKPFIQIQASLLVEGKNIKQDIAKNYTIKGTALTTLNYSGNARNLNKDKFLSDSMNLNVYLLFNNLSYKKNGNNPEYILNGKANLDKQKLSFDKLHLKSSFGEVLLKGKVEQFLQFILERTHDLKATIDAKSPLINLNSFLNSAATNTANANKNKQKSDFLDKTSFDFKINLSADKLLLRQIETTHALINLEYKNGLLNFSKFHVRTCDGEISASGKIQDFKKINALVNIQNVDAPKLFKQFENFGQDAVKSENLRGKISVEATFSAELDDKNEFKGESMKTDATVKLKDGHLLDYEPLQNISNFIFKQRDFKDVTFTEINEALKVRGFEIEIDELEIASNVLNLYIVNGMYNLKGNSNINILIPWNNLKKRGKNYIPKESGQSAENAKGLKLNFSGPSKKMKLSFGHKEQEKRFW